jgi:plastocyanin domain-containing protein
MMILNDMDKSDRQFLISTCIGSLIAPLLVWWFLTGRHKYSTKGMK